MSYGIVDGNGTLVKTLSGAPVGVTLEHGQRFSYKETLWEVPMNGPGYFKVTRTTTVELKHTASNRIFNLYIESTSFADLQAWIKRAREFAGFKEIEGYDDPKLPNLISMSIKGKFNRFAWLARWIWNGNTEPVHLAVGYNVLLLVMRTALGDRSPQFVVNWALNALDRWTDATAYPGARYAVSADLQERVSEITGYPICEYCQWVIEPDNNHEFCEEQLAQ